MARSIFRPPRPVPLRRKFVGTVPAPEIHNLVSTASVGSGAADVMSITKNFVHVAWGSGTSVSISSREAAVSSPLSAAGSTTGATSRDTAAVSAPGAAGHTATVLARSASLSPSPSAAGMTTSAAAHDVSAAVSAPPAGYAAAALSHLTNLITTPAATPAASTVISRAVSVGVTAPGGPVASPLTALSVPMSGQMSTSVQVTGLSDIRPAIVLSCPVSGSLSAPAHPDASAAIPAAGAGHTQPDILVNRPAVGSSVGAVCSIPAAGHDLSEAVGAAVAGGLSLTTSTAISPAPVADLAIIAAAARSVDVLAAAAADGGPGTVTVIFGSRDLLSRPSAGADAGGYPLVESETILVATAPAAGHAQSVIISLRDTAARGSGAGGSSFAVLVSVMSGSLAHGGSSLALDGSHDEPQTSSASAGPITTVSIQQESTDGLSVSAFGALFATAAILHGAESHAEGTAGPTLSSPHTRTFEAVLTALGGGQAQPDARPGAGIQASATAAGAGEAAYDAELAATINALATIAGSAGGVIEHRAGADLSADGSPWTTAEIIVRIPLSAAATSAAGGEPDISAGYPAVLIADVTVSVGAYIDQAGIPPGDQSSEAVISGHTVRVEVTQTRIVPAGPVITATATATRQSVAAGISRSEVGGS